MGESSRTTPIQVEIESFAKEASQAAVALTVFLILAFLMGCGVVSTTGRTMILFLVAFFLCAVPSVFLVAILVQSNLSFHEALAEQQSEAMRNIAEQKIEATRNIAPKAALRSRTKTAPRCGTRMKPRR